MGTLPQWILFNLFVIAALALDLGVFHRRPHRVGLREAAWWSVVWIVTAILFGFGVLHFYGRQPGLEYFTGYIVEKALSIDNLFVFLIIFRALAVPAELQHRVLAWGVLGALIMRGAMIAAGAALIERFTWVLWLLGAFLIYAGAHMLFAGEGEHHPERSRFLRFANRHLRVTHGYRGARFFVHENGRRYVTLLFVVLILVELTDATFAIDSIPAVFGVTRNAFIVYTSNVFAVLGLRSLYFLLAGVLDRLRYLSAGLAFVLMFIGAKMLAEPWVHVPTGISLTVVLGILAVAVGASLLWPRAKEELQKAQTGLAPQIACLSNDAETIREGAALALHEAGRARAMTATREWWNDPRFAALMPRALAVTVGVAVRRDTFVQIRAANGMPPLAAVPAEQDAEEFELHWDGGASLDILTARNPAGSGAIARFLEKSGEGIQQVEFACPDVAEATRILREAHGVMPVYPEARPGANGTLVNFFLLPAEDGKVLIELYQPAKNEQQVAL